MFNTFVSQGNKDPLICAMPMAIYVANELLWVRKEYGGPMKPLELPQKELARKRE